MSHPTARFYIHYLQFKDTVSSSGYPASNCVTISLVHHEGCEKEGVAPHLKLLCPHLLVPVAERSKARVCGRSLAWIAGSNPAGGTDVCK